MYLNIDKEYQNIVYYFKLSCYSSETSYQCEKIKIKIYLIIKYCEFTNQLIKPDSGIECLIELDLKWFNKRLFLKEIKEIIEIFINQLTVKLKAVK